MIRPTRRVALWRAVNLGRHHRLPMAELKDALVALGLADVSTLLQTGNAVFKSALKSPQLETRLEDESARRWGIATPVMVRTAPEWTSIVRDNPFSEPCRTAPNRVLLLCLKEAAVPGAAEALTRAIKGPEQFHVAGRHVYLVYPNGIGTSTLTPVALERALGTAATARNWNTVLKIDGLLGRNLTAGPGRG